MKVGIITTPFISEEISKDEFVPVNDKRPWIKTIKNEMSVADDISIT